LKQLSKVRARIFFVYAALGVGWFAPSVQSEDAGGIPREAATSYPPRPYYGVDARVSAIERASDGRSATIRFRTLANSWSYKKEDGKKSSLERGTIELSLPWTVSNEPVPVCVGLEVGLRVSRSGEVLVVNYCPDTVLAGRRGPDGRWEFIVKASTIAGKHFFLRLAPRAFDGVCEEVRWTKKYGLIMATFSDGEYGDDSIAEVESATLQKLGWPIANQADQRILPGHDGWLRLPKFEGGIQNKDTSRWMAEDVLRSQRLPGAVP
jgi:hypothetical protein